ncbi:hypothetical protein BpHYR1_020989 [Brachionus plicatilis]|uniref:Uncharacterized protein n=1 Tax=Brachionus plicatilis TaxID=10195 RepID=A0A3M7T209_BRAPC|nr:hypothetical protein BpHYR1_020989 [Brachionus plicatilis]
MKKTKAYHIKDIEMMHASWIVREASLFEQNNKTQEFNYTSSAINLKRSLGFLFQIFEFFSIKSGYFSSKMAKNRKKFLIINILNSSGCDLD